LTFLPRAFTDMRRELTVEHRVSFVAYCCHVDLSNVDCERNADSLLALPDYRHGRRAATALDGTDDESPAH
jgi:hypothetical protein